MFRLNQLITFTFPFISQSMENPIIISITVERIQNEAHLNGIKLHLYTRLVWGVTRVCCLRSKTYVPAFYRRIKYKNEFGCV